MGILLHGKVLQNAVRQLVAQVLYSNVIREVDSHGYHRTDSLLLKEYCYTPAGYFYTTVDRNLCQLESSPLRDMEPHP